MITDWTIGSAWAPFTTMVIPILDEPIEQLDSERLARIQENIDRALVDMMVYRVVPPSPIPEILEMPDEESASSRWLTRYGWLFGSAPAGRRTWALLMGCLDSAPEPEPIPNTDAGLGALLADILHLDDVAAVNREAAEICEALEPKAAAIAL